MRENVGISVGLKKQENAHNQKISMFYIAHSQND